jgi:hypothetical protein
MKFKIQATHSRRILNVCYLRDPSPSRGARAFLMKSTESFENNSLALDSGIARPADRIRSVVRGVHSERPFFAGFTGDRPSHPTCFRQ